MEQNANKDTAKRSRNSKNWQRFMKNLIGVNHLLLFAAAVFSAVTVWLWSVCAEAVGVWNPVRLWGEVQLQLQFPASYRGFSRLKGLQLIIRHAGGVQAVELFQLLVLSLAAAAVYLLLAGIIRLCSTAVANARADKQMQALEKLEQEAKELARADMAQLNEQTEKLAALTEDIENLSPTSPDAHIRADYPELQGISHAVNDLMQRMNESYRQQVQFVSDASHELRTPIAVIKGYADMLDRWGTEDESVLREGIAAIKNETDNMNRLVEQLLFLARGDSGRTQLQLQTVSLTDLMRELYSECEMIDKQHTYTLHADGEVSVQADRALLKQAARVLCDNAAKYTPEGGEIMLRAGLDGEGAPCLSVEDRGIGISKKDAPSLFNRFFRADKGRQQNAKGSGLGLSIAKWIVQQHGGKLDVTSVENVGTRIRITLPKEQ